MSIIIFKGNKEFPNAGNSLIFQDLTSPIIANNFAQDRLNFHQIMSEI